MPHADHKKDIGKNRQQETIGLCVPGRLAKIVSAGSDALSVQAVMQQKQKQHHHETGELKKEFEQKAGGQNPEAKLLNIYILLAEGCRHQDMLCMCAGISACPEALFVQSQGADPG